ncbi:MAG TPA: hypothetical protein VMJ10_15545 [Kofleriaceae bacterium]|nr:hypothetical protein [Kofleriaceae bacterium]
MVRGAVVATLLVAGCAQIAGIDDTTGGNGLVTLHVTALYDGATVVEQPLDVTMQTASWFDSTTDDTYAATQTDSNGWSADVASSSPVAQFTLPDVPTPYTHLVASGSRDVTYPEVFYGHPSATPPPSGASFMVQVVLPTPIAATEQYQIAAVGAWMTDVLSATEAPVTATSIGPETIDYSEFAPSTPSPAAAITSADLVAMVRYTSGTLTGALVFPAFDQTGSPAPLTGTLTAVTADQTFTATIDPTTAAARYGALRPAMTGFAVTWGLYAAPGATIDSGAGIRLASGAPAMTDTSLTASYGNPFTAQSWPPLFEYVTSANRSSVAGGITIGLGAGIYTVTDTSANQNLSLPVGLPELVTIDQMPLNTDGMALALAPGPVDVSFIADQQSNTSYELTMYDIVVTGTTVTHAPVFDYVGPTTDFVVPAELFHTGHTYVIRASCIAGGEPGFATGDLVTRSLPMSVGYFDSAVFTVQ